MNNKSIAIISCALLLMLSAVANAQTESSSTTKKVASKSRKADPDTISRPRRFRFYATLANSFDTNINRDAEGLNSYGIVPSFGVNFSDKPDRPSVEINYEIAAHHYTNTKEWNRISQLLSIAYRKRFSGRWSLRTEGEMSLKGSSEDRELNNQYSLGARLEYRPTESTRLQLLAAYRLKRDPIDPGSNAIDPYVGSRIIQRVFGNRRLELSYRYDKNRAWDPRNRYIRWTYDLEFATPVRNDRNLLTIGLTYKPRLYARTLRVNRERVPRHDERWIFQTSFERRLRPNLQSVMFYQYEVRTSNDVDKDFKAHQAGFALTYLW
jgi:hypothetical protein